MNRCVQLPLALVLAEMFLQDVQEKIIRQGMIGFGAKRMFDLLQQTDVLERRLAEESFSGENVGFGKGPAFRRDLDIAFLKADESQYPGSLDDRQQIIHLHDQISRKAMQIISPATVEQNLH